MSVVLDLADIQGNVLNAYGKQGYPVGRFILFHVNEAAAGRAFVMELLPLVTTALRWTGPGDPGVPVPRPEVAVNIAFTFPGLFALEIPTRTLRGLPDEFIDGMAKRAPMLGDDYHTPATCDPKTAYAFMKGWDKVWRRSETIEVPLADPKAVHILVTLNADIRTLEVTDKISSPAMEKMTERVLDTAAKHNVSLLKGHGLDDDAPYQDLSALFERDANGNFVLAPDGPLKGKPIPLPTEHFGFRDGISDPVFDGQYPGKDPKAASVGGGAIDEDGNWRPLAAGEFLLGYPDEAQELSGSTLPIDFCRNGTFMAYRKLSQNVSAWEKFIDKAAEGVAKAFGISPVSDARELLMATMAGRWSDGVPTVVASTLAEWRKFNTDYPVGSAARELAFVDFKYAGDLKGAKCPMTSHVRRVNTRDGLDPIALTDEGAAKGGKLAVPANSVLNNRRRILRRGLPYGGGAHTTAKGDDRGIIMLVVCASLFRQFEFVQQQWINYGLDSYSGNATCPIVGNHSLGADEPNPAAKKRNGPKAKFVVPAPPGSDRPPYVVEGLPQFVETRGGDYFFVPSLTALSMIAMGTTDPT